MQNSVLNIAVFIDFENFNERQFEPQKLLDKLKERGRIIVKRAYADWGRFSGQKRSMMENSIDLIEMPTHSSRGKNSSDIKLVVDALEVAMTKDYIDTFVVVSGDSDFTPLISKLRELNKYVIVIGQQKKDTSSLLRGYCDELYYYDLFIGSKPKDQTADVAEAYALLRRAMSYFLENESQVLGSRVKQFMRQLDSSFSESKYGFSSLKLFWARAAQDRVINFEAGEHGDYLLSLWESGMPAPTQRQPTPSPRFEAQPPRPQRPPMPEAPIAEMPISEQPAAPELNAKPTSRTSNRSRNITIRPRPTHVAAETPVVPPPAPEPITEPIAEPTEKQPTEKTSSGNKRKKSNSKKAEPKPAETPATEAPAAAPDEPMAANTADKKPHRYKRKKPTKPDNEG